MKRTMSARNVAKFHKMLANDVSLKQASKLLNIDVKALQEFTPAKMQALKSKQAEEAARKEAENKEAEAAAKTLAAAAKSVTKKKDK